MTKEEIEAGLLSLDLETRKSFAENSSLRLTKSQINRGLNDSSPIIRYIFACRCIRKANDKKPFTHSQIENGLKDRNSSVRSVFMRHNNILISPQNIEDFLKDSSVEVKVSLAKNRGINFTEKQKMEGIKSNIKRIRGAFAERVSHEDGVNKILNDTDAGIKSRFVSRSFFNISRYQLEKGLIDSSPNVRISFYSPSIDIESISYHQLERGLRDNNNKVRAKFSNKEYKFYTKKQVARGLNDAYIKVRCSFAANSNIELSENQIADILRSNSYSVIYSFIRYSNSRSKLTSEQVEMLLNSKFPEIKAVLAESEDLTLTEEQIKRGLNDKNNKVMVSFINRYGTLKCIDATMVERMLTGAEEVRRAIVAKDGIVFTQDQANRGLIDTNMQVRANFVAHNHDKLTDEQIENALIDEEPLVRETAAMYIGSQQITPEQIERGLKDIDERVRLVFIERSDFTLNKMQIDRALKDDSQWVRLALLNRKGIAITQDQVRYLLEDSSFDIVRAVKNRGEYLEYRSIGNSATNKTSINNKYSH